MSEALQCVHSPSCPAAVCSAAPPPACHQTPAAVSSWWIQSPWWLVRTSASTLLLSHQHVHSHNLLHLICLVCLYLNMLTLAAYLAYKYKICHKNTLFDMGISVNKYIPPKFCVVKYIYKGWWSFQSNISCKLANEHELNILHYKWRN